MALVGCKKTISEFLKYMDVVEQASELTLKAYLIDLKQAFGEDLQFTAPPQALLEKAKKAMINWSCLKASTRNRKVACLKSYFNFLLEKKYIEEDLASFLTCPKVPKKIPHFISVDEVLSILKVFANDHHPSPEEILFLLLYGAGLRVSEACQLKWIHASQSQRTLLILGKGSKERIVVIPHKVSQRLFQWNPEKQWIWGEKPLSPSLAYLMIRQLGIRSGLHRPLHPHALRHSFATHLLSGGANLRTLQELLGHSTLAATEKYLHLGLDQLARTIENSHALRKLSK